MIVADLVHLAFVGGLAALAALLAWLARADLRP